MSRPMRPTPGSGTRWITGTCCPGAAAAGADFPAEGDDSGGAAVRAEAGGGARASKAVSPVSGILRMTGF